MPNRDEFTKEPKLPLGRYRHYKGGEYEVLTLACDEATHEWLVVYKALYDTHCMPNVWTRPYKVFTEDVVVDSDIVPRFKQVY